MKNRAYPAFLLAVALALFTGLIATHAQAFERAGHGRHSRWGYRHRPHLYAGGELLGFVIASQATDSGYLGHGGGGGLFVGGRIGPYLSVEGNWMISYHDETFSTPTALVTDLNAIYLMSVTLDGKVHMPTFGPVEPYFQAGIGYAFIGTTYLTSGDSISANGLALHLGGGLDYWLGPWFTVGGRLLYRGLYMGQLNNGLISDSFVNGIGLDLNAAFHF